MGVSSYIWGLTSSALYATLLVSKCFPSVLLSLFDSIHQHKCWVKCLWQTPGLKADLGQPHRSGLNLPGQVLNVAVTEIIGYRWSVCTGLGVDCAPPSKSGHTSHHSSPWPSPVRPRRYHFGCSPEHTDGYSETSINALALRVHVGLLEPWIEQLMSHAIIMCYRNVICATIHFTLVNFLQHFRQWKI